MRINLLRVLFSSLLIISIGVIIFNYSHYGFEVRINLIPFLSSPHAYSVALFSLLFLALDYLQKDKGFFIWILCDGIYESLGQLNIIQYYVLKNTIPAIYSIVFDYQHVLIETGLLVLGIWLCRKKKIEINYSVFIVVFAYALVILANAYMSEFVNNSFTIPEFYFELLFVTIMIMLFYPERKKNENIPFSN